VLVFNVKEQETSWFKDLDLSQFWSIKNRGPTKISKHKKPINCLFQV